MFAKIVVGMDGSGQSVKAMHVACDLSKKYEAELRVIHVPQPAPVALPVGAVAGYHVTLTAPTKEDIQREANNVLDQAKGIAKEYDQPIADTQIDFGDPAKRIVNYAELYDADLIVTGRRGLGAVGALVQGSTSLSINHLATCACLSVE